MFMKTIRIRELRVTNGTVVERASTDGDSIVLLPASGGGLRLDELIHAKERFIKFSLKALSEHSVNLRLMVYGKDAADDDYILQIRFGVMPNVETLLCFDLHWLNAGVLFPENTPGQLKVVCHGRRVMKEEVERIVLGNCPAFHDIQVELSDIELTDERPQKYPLPEVKLIDKFGQYKGKSWPNKILSDEMLRERLRQGTETSVTCPIKHWDEYGGLATKKLKAGTGFFTRTKENGKWWLVDPLGNAFFSVGPDGVSLRSDCRVDDMEALIDWLPDRDDPLYKSMYQTQLWPVQTAERTRTCTLFSYKQANLYRAFGEEWYSHWQQLMTIQLKNIGCNTLGNWSDEALLRKGGMPYVTMLPRFPSTKALIFRDFPDVFSAEYALEADECAKYLTSLQNDKYMIGYFLRNEPAWAFVDGLIIADEVLYNSNPSCCKDRLIETLQAKYTTPEALSSAWNCSFKSFDDLRSSIINASKLSQQAEDDLRMFSREMLRAYVEIPSKACRAADPNHMILGMRWAWISDPDIITGWENFDVFSINCYAVDPTLQMDNVATLGVDLPIVIGEFHFGALDGGVTATGLEGVLTQADRGIAYRYYCERVAAHPMGVGCHYYQCYDQFELGRFDGENYNIGIFDICSQPYGDFVSGIRACSETLYQVADGTQSPAEQKPNSIPMIAY